MSDGRLLIGPALRRLRRNAGITQASMAQQLDISPSYLNLLERNQRPVSARLMLALAERFNIDPRDLALQEPGGGTGAMRRRLADPVFADLALDATEIDDWLIAAPGTARAFARLYDQVHSGLAAGGTPVDDPVAKIRAEIERWRNHFSDLDHAAEALADTLRLQSGDLYAAIAERLRTKHQLAIRVLPEEVMPGRLRRLDLHARQLQLSEMLDMASRTFQAAYLLGQLEHRSDVNALVAGAQFGDRTAERLYQRHIFSYLAAAVIMPYGRFLRACEQGGYDMLVLQRRFGAGFEHVAHRLTTLQRVGARGLPFFMVRVDRAGQVSKRFGGANQAPLADTEVTCPLWHLHQAFSRPSDVQVQLVELEDASRWLTLARSVQGAGYGAAGTTAQFAIGLGVAAEHAANLCYARGLDLSAAGATRIGPGCAMCKRGDCPQRSKPPIGIRLTFDDRERGITPFDFVTD
ncbi:short-chain fatty acyl-CoA regulator family protein [Blastomonas sp.]|uniref:helix-turn-helix domain-containing protein n=1 Tax=Blastomonas sp. TaxID=1909299 RepID=UPI0035932959